MTEIKQGESPDPGSPRRGYADDHGPYDDVKLPAGIGSGLSGMPQAEASVVPPLWADEDSAPAPSRYRPRRPQA